MSSHAKSAEVDAYLAKLAPGHAADLQTLRDLIHETLPGIRETMHYKMPTFEFDEPVCALAAQKHHLGFYVCNKAIFAASAADFSHLNCGKWCIRFREISDLPRDAVVRVLQQTAQATHGWHGLQ